MSNMTTYRECENMSRAALAAATGTSERHIAFIEQGKRNPSICLALKIANALKCEVGDIFTLENCTNSSVENKAQ